MNMQPMAMRCYLRRCSTASTQDLRRAIAGRILNARWSWRASSIPLTKALRMAQISPDLAASSSYYGSMVPTLFAGDAPRCATIAHFGRFDQGIPMEGVEKLIEKGHPTAQIFVYEANHGFNSDRRKDYHEESADLARERTLALFRACGG